MVDVKVKSMNRRLFFKRLSLAMLLPAALLSFFSIKRQKQTQEKNRILIDQQGLQDQQIENGVFVRIINGDVAFYLAKCSHLGCQINHIKEGVLVCPCHGSKYNLNGQVINGPSTKDLRLLKYDYLADEKKYLIYKNT